MIKQSLWQARCKIDSYAQVLVTCGYRQRITNRRSKDDRVRTNCCDLNAATSARNVTENCFLKRGVLAFESTR